MKSPIDLHVRIPKRFREKLEARFDPSLAETYENGLSRIRSRCWLCDEFYAGWGGCYDACPFAQYGDSRQIGCLRWVKLVLGHAPSFLCSAHITWQPEDDAAAREDLRKLREAAENGLIEWIDDE